MSQLCSPYFPDMTNDSTTKMVRVSIFRLQRNTALPNIKWTARSIYTSGLFARGPRFRRWQQDASSFIGNKHLPGNLANDAFIDSAIALRVTEWPAHAAGDKLQIFRCKSSRKVLSPKIVRHTVDSGIGIRKSH